MPCISLWACRNLKNFFSIVMISLIRYINYWIYVEGSFDDIKTFLLFRGDDIVHHNHILDHRQHLKKLNGPNLFLHNGFLHNGVSQFKHL